VIEAERNGADAVVIGCGNDPALQQSREAVDIPVVGPLESSLLVATMLGHKFAVVTILKKFIPLIERQIKLYGLEGRAIAHRPVRYCEVNFDRFREMVLEPKKRIIPEFEKEAMESIEAGAEVIVTGCCGLGPGLTLAGYKEVRDTGVPIVDMAVVALKVAEMLADLRKTIGLSTSKHCWYKLPITKEVLEKSRKVFYPASA
jgi:allantoin racemase